MRKIIIVSLGHGDENQLTRAAVHALTSAPTVILRTERHGAAAWLRHEGIAFTTLDDLYPASISFSELNEKVADRLLSYNGPEPLCYAVADLTEDRTVAALLGRNAADITLIPGVTASAHFSAASATITPDGFLTFPAAVVLQTAPNPRIPCLVTELNSRVMTGDVKLALLVLYPPNTVVLFLHHGKTTHIPLSALDRQSAYDHTSCVFLPPLSMKDRNRHDFYDLVDLMNTLRGDNGCPWDLAQTHESLRQYMIEEAYETVSAIDQKEDDRICDELGDVLLQVVFHATIGRQHGCFDINDVTSAIVNKMISRHRHIFGGDSCTTPGEVIENWEKIKKEEKGIIAYSGLMEDIPEALPALMYASKVQQKAKQVGFDFSNARDALQKTLEEAGELDEALAYNADAAEELGDLLFSCVNVARILKIQPELCLREATRKFIKRFTHMEKRISAEGKTMEDLTLEEMDVYWQCVKTVQDT
ncbi:MAG: nucleoside triphosphate pyrophosphohydrolase [Clostridia bacterium]|nr:nucleoside triphosphate pyrophosphohydrolase [Clostridia bacterium]